MVINKLNTADRVLSRRRFFESFAFASIASQLKENVAFGDHEARALRGNHFELVIDWLTVNYTGRPEC